MAAEHAGMTRHCDFSLVSRRGLRWAEHLAASLRVAGRSVAINDPFHLERDLVR